LRDFVNENCPEMALGIGTIFTAEEAKDYIDMGTDFIVQPITSLEVGEVCREHKIPWLPAAATLNEIWYAKQAGATVVKLFPGNVLGPGFVKAIKGPLPNIKVMVTGGVEPTQESIQSWLKAGANYLGMGSQLFAGELKTAEDFSKLSLKVKQVLSY
jgi:2-dehydro-3-deoxyphosphogluconate aldolase/(4S)-4-hydroxy-2-oxoglutarate aldolase